MTKPTKWLCAQRRSRSACAGCPSWSESSLGAHAILLVLSCSPMQYLVVLWNHVSFAYLLFHCILWARENLKRRAADSSLMKMALRNRKTAHEMMVLFVLRKLILQTSMGSHPVGLDAWFLVGPFVCCHTSCVRTMDAQARLRFRWSPMWKVL